MSHALYLSMLLSVVCFRANDVTHQCHVAHTFLLLLQDVDQLYRSLLNWICWLSFILVLQSENKLFCVYHPLEPPAPHCHCMSCTTQPRDSVTDLHTTVMNMIRIHPLNLFKTFKSNKHIYSNNPKNKFKNKYLSFVFVWRISRLQLC